MSLTLTLHPKVKDMKPSRFTSRRNSNTNKVLAAAVLSFSLASAPILAPATASAASSAAHTLRADQLVQPDADTAPLTVTELDSGNDNTTTRDYPFVELTNPGSKPVTIGKDGLNLSYITEDTTKTANDVELEVDAPVTIKPNEKVVLWLTPQRENASEAAGEASAEARDGAKASGKPQATQEDIAAFKKAWKLKDSARVEIAHGLESKVEKTFGLRISDSQGKELTRAFTSTETAEPSDVAEPGETAEPSQPAEPNESAAPTDAESPAETTEPTESASEQPSESSSDGPSESPSGSASPSESADPSKEPAPAAGNLGKLLITELVPDSTNVGGSDGYEFIEIYNPTNTAINLRDYQLHYLYILNDLTITNSAEWPMEPHDAVVEPGKTVVVWIKNGPNDNLSAEDFAKHYGVNLEDFTLVENKSAGMANGSPRGMELRTRTGEKVHRVNYNVTGEKDPAKDIGIHYAANPDDPGNANILEKSAATPGSIKPEQAPGSVIDIPEDAEAPVIKDQSPKSLDPNKNGELKFKITDNVQVRRVELTLSSNADPEPQVHNVTNNGDGNYTFTIPKADLLGKRYFEYTVTASDGTNETTTEKVRIPLDGVNTDPLRLNVKDGEFVRGTVPLSVASDTPGEKLGVCVNDKPLTDTHASLEKAPTFAFETSQTDTFFRNGVLVDGDVLHIFDEGTYAEWATVSTDVPLNYVTAGKPLQVDIAAGTKAAPGPDPNENNDDFVVRNVRLVLPDGRTLRAPGWEDPTQIIQMGDSTGKVEVLEAPFTIPEDAYNAQAAQWDSTTVADGEHTVCGTSPDGARTERTIKVDNTAPAITTSVKDGEEKRGGFTIDFDATDKGSGLDTIEATLNGEKIDNGTELSSVTMPAGTHTLEITAKDKIGNVSKRTLTFTTPVEQPNGTISNQAGAILNVCTPGSLTARVSDPSGDPLTVSFREGHTSSLESETLTAVSGTVNNANQTERNGDTLTAGGTTTSDTELPFHAFTTAVPEDAGEDALVRLAWEGTTDPGARIRLLVWNTATNAYQEVDVALTDKKTGEATLEAMVPLGEHAVDGEIRAVVQHSEGWAGPNLSGRDSAVEPYHPDDTPRSEYDFTFAWETDTQYYNESFYDHQIAIHNYLLERREPLNLQYLFHTGDIVDKAEQQFQWDNANKAYKMLDDAGLPYGVLAGNHDVGHMSNDFTEYSKNFGAHRFAHNPWYGGSYQNNRGHYDLITAGGHDFIMLYMGWAPGDEEIAWMNEVLKAYPERTAIINLHEYMLTTGGLGPIPQRIYDEVITPNPNVRAVMSGHYHDAYTRVDRFDDNGDGEAERTVTQMLFDYQALPEGGQGFLRLMHFDNKGQHVKVRTFSPSLKQYNAEDATLEPEHQEFTLSYDALGLEARTKSLTTAKARVDVLTAKELGSVENVESDTEAKVSVENLSDGDHTIYVLTTDPYGAKHYSALQRVTIQGGDCDIEKPDNPGTDVEPEKPGKPGTPAKPSAPAKPIAPGKPGGPGGPGKAPDGDSAGAGATGAGTTGAGDTSPRQHQPNRPAVALAATGADVTALGLAAVALTMGGAAMAWMLRRRTR